MTFDEARAAFPVLERVAYLNAGTFGPLSRRTAAATEEQLRADLAGGRGGLPYFETMTALRERVRAQLGDLLRATPEHVALTSSTSEGCNIVLAGLGLGPEDEVVTTDVEHFGLLGPLHASGARVRVAAVRDRPSTEALEAILAEVTPRTRLIGLSHVAWTTGNVLPVAKLRANVDVPLLVDGAQSVGAIEVDATPFDFYTVSGQKWLCGPDSTGGLYVRDPERLRVARPSYFSQARYEPTGRFEPRAGAARFDGGWVATAALAGLSSALDEPPAWRFERAAATAARCRELLAEHLQVVTEPGQATLVTFRPRGDATALAKAAGERGVVIRDVPGTGWLRASCGYWTSDEDLQRLVEAVTS